MDRQISCETSITLICGTFCLCVRWYILTEGPKQWLHQSVFCHHLFWIQDHRVLEFVQLQGSLRCGQVAVLYQGSHGKHTKHIHIHRYGQSRSPLNLPVCPYTVERHHSTKREPMHTQGEHESPHRYASTQKSTQERPAEAVLTMSPPCCPYTKLIFGRTDIRIIVMQNISLIASLHCLNQLLCCAISHITSFSIISC